MNLPAGVDLCIAFADFFVEAKFEEDAAAYQCVEAHQYRRFDQKPLLVAGFYIDGSANDSGVPGLVIFTVGSQQTETGLVPAVLDDADVGKWLESEPKHLPDLISLLRPFDSDPIERSVVSKPDSFSRPKL
jgi:putative SOS response-associated peptidase YedK